MPDLDLGHDHYGWWASWKPDRKLNPQYNDLPDVEHAMLTIGHRNGRTGEPCFGAVTLKQNSRYDDLHQGHVWDVLSMEPLHLEPSVLCKAPTGDGVCGDHGYIRGGRWEAC